MDEIVRKSDFWEKAEEKWYWLLLFAFSVYIAQGVINILYLKSWLDEGNYLMKSFWYVTGQVQPYSNEDATWYMPFFFYELGWWQRLFGIGHYSGRIFSFSLGLLNLGVLFAVAKKIFRKRLLAALSVVFLATSPMTVKYFCTATPLAIVSLLSLLTFYVLLRQNESNWILSSTLVGLGYFLLYFHRPNMIIGIVLFILFQWAFANNLKTIRVFISIGIASILSVCILSIFPDKLSFYATRLPYVTSILMQIGILKSQSNLSLPTNSISPRSPLGGVSGWYTSMRYFVSHYVMNYFPVVIFSLIGLFAALKEKIILKPVGFISVYFVIMSAGHFLGSQSYCMGCIQGYTNYFFVFGAMASVYAIIFVLKPTLPSVTEYQKGLVFGLLSMVIFLITMYAFKVTLSFVTEYQKGLVLAFLSIFIIALIGIFIFSTALSSVTEYQKGLMHGLISIFVIASIGIYSHHLPYLMSHPKKSYVSVVNGLAKQIRSIVPENEGILVIGSYPYYAQHAVFLAGRKLELTNINPDKSYIALRDGLSKDAKKQAIKQLHNLTLWTDASMRNWIKKKYNFIIISEGFKVDEFKPLVEKYFEKLPPISVYNKTLDIYIRKGFRD